MQNSTPDPTPAALTRLRAYVVCASERLMAVTRHPARAADSAKPPHPQPISSRCAPALGASWRRMRSYLASWASTSDRDRPPSNNADEYLLVGPRHSHYRYLQRYS